MRIKGLDFIRAIAVVLVIFRHGPMENNWLHHFGWLGVDLFFVLSGFLVSGLLFKEYKKRNRVNIGRFLLRRGFKIYPPFYVFLLYTIFAHWYTTGEFYNTTNLIHEALYLQSYLPAIHLHTWTLAVEEHFYFTLAFLIFIGVRFRWLRSVGWILYFFSFLFVLSFCLRWAYVYPHKTSEFLGFLQTHLRADGIIVGVAFSYLYHFTNYLRIVFRKWYLFLILAAVLIAPGFHFKGAQYFMSTIGLTTVNLGFGIIVLLSLKTDVLLRKINTPVFWAPFNVVCFIGVHSYSIYLWHMVAKGTVYQFFAFEPLIMELLYVLFSIVLGIILSFLIERTALKVRDRLTNRSYHLKGFLQKLKWE